VRVMIHASDSNSQDARSHCQPEPDHARAVALCPGSLPTRIGDENDVVHSQTRFRARSRVGQRYPYLGVS